MGPREKYESILTTKSGSQMVAPSKVGSQFYCEKKVHLERELGGVETETMRRGTETHEKAAEDAEPVDTDEMWNAIERGERQTVIETMFPGEIDEFAIFGIPDAIVFDEGVPQLIFDRKTTSLPGRLFKNQRVQVWLYGYMMESLGFETDDLQLTILAHEQALDPELGKQLQKQILQTDSNDRAVGETELLEEPTALVHCFDYATEDHIDDLRWALEYWRGERDPVPTEKAAKCRSCPFNEECSDSLVS